MTGEIVIYHNPNCGTSRNSLTAIREAGHAPLVIEYLKAGWRREQIQDLLRKMGLTAQDILRVRGTPAEALGLTDSKTSDGTIPEAMVAHPILVERPIVVTPKGAALCRPVDKVRALLQASKTITERAIWRCFISSNASLTCLSLMRREIISSSLSLPAM